MHHSVSGAQGGQKRTRIGDGCELPSVCWESNPGLLEGATWAPTSDSSLQPPTHVLRRQKMEEEVAH